jgi:hypothetical protein
MLSDVVKALHFAGVAPFLDDRQSFSAAPLNKDKVFKIAQWWHNVVHSITLDDTIVLPPGPRTLKDDFVRKGLRMESEHVALVRGLWADFLRDHDTLSRDVFSGRGVALIGGKLQYLVPSLVAIRALRRTGCKLPIELWFPDNEVMPTPQLQQLLAKLGVHIRTLQVPKALGQVRAAALVCGVLSAACAWHESAYPMPSTRDVGHWMDHWA